MKRFALLALLAGALGSSTGCIGTPGYSGVERNRQISRNMVYDAGQIVDDFDSALLLRPASHMTKWNVQ